MRILLIQPYGSGHPPLGLCYLASVLEKDGYDNIKIIDLNSSSKSPYRSAGYLKKQLKKYPDVVGVTSTTASVDNAIELGKMAREYCDTIMYGGPHASLFQERILEKVPEFDIVACGEADCDVSETMHRIENKRSLKGVSGLIYRENGKIKRNAPSQLITNLDAIPFPAKHLLDLEDYHGASSVLTSRGCPNKCTYCSNQISGKAWRGRSTKNVVDEIEFLLNEYPKIMKNLDRNINISDENFNLNPRRAKEICDEIVRRRLDITLTFINGLHVRNVDLELMRKMKKAGCREVWYGVESGNDKILKRIKKNVTKAMIRSAVKKAKKAGIETVGGHFIVGLETETLQTARDTIDFFKELKLDVGGFNQATPFPYTGLWDYVLKNGKFLFDYEDVVNYESFKMSNTTPQFETKEFTRDERVIAYGEAVQVLDSVLRKRALSTKMVFRRAKKIRSPDDLMKAIYRLKHLIFDKDLRRKT